MKVLFLCGFILLSGLAFAYEIEEIVEDAPKTEPEHVPEPEPVPEQCSTVKHQRCSKADKACSPEDSHCVFTQICPPFFVKKCCKVLSVEKKCVVVRSCIPKFSYEKVCEDVKRCPPKKQCKNVCRQVDLGDHKVKSICEQECKVVEHPGPCKLVHTCFSKWVSKKDCTPRTICSDNEKRECREVSSH